MPFKYFVLLLPIMQVLSSSEGRLEVTFPSLGLLVLEWVSRTNTNPFASNEIRER